jgi:hypothetical protein
LALPSHGRYDYSSIKSRKPYRWPNGTSLAVYLALNLEHFAFGEGLGAELAPGGPQPDILNFACATTAIVSASGGCSISSMRSSGRHRFL